VKHDNPHDTGNARREIGVDHGARCRFAALATLSGDERAAPKMPEIRGCDSAPGRTGRENDCSKRLDINGR
jgi:hypothetical protein